jgi:hypothetical protein
MQAFDLNYICERPLFAGFFTVNDSVKPVTAQSHNCEQIFAPSHVSHGFNFVNQPVTGVVLTASVEPHVNLQQIGSRIPLIPTGRAAWSR